MKGRRIPICIGVPLDGYLEFETLGVAAIGRMR